MVEAIRWTGERMELLDQRCLPRKTEWIVCENAADAADAIRDMVVRGAPAIGIVAAYGLALEQLRGGDLQAACRRLLDSRPTAVNLRWAVERMSACPGEGYVAEAVAIHEEDIAINRAMGDHGAKLLPDNPVVYHHCNTGALATGGWGTALGVVRSAAAMGKKPHVIVGETRPYLQGARLTAYELQQEQISCELVADSAAASLLARCDAVLVGCDRVAANGDVANKIGTYGLAVLAKHMGVPFYVCMPTSTLDNETPDGPSILIEQRSADEVLGHAGVVWAADVPVNNPAFDVTPAALVTAWVTENGLWRPPE